MSTETSFSAAGPVPPLERLRVGIGSKPLGAAKPALSLKALRSAARKRVWGNYLPMAGLLSFVLALAGHAAQSMAPHGQAPAQVRGFGDPGHLEFHGNTTFTATDFRQSLVCRSRFLTASQPGAPLKEFLMTVQEELLAGYQRSGFPEARVEVRPVVATERVLVNIEEGPRFRCRKVRIVGTRGAIAAQLISCLTNPPDANDDEAENPRWTPGEPACFDPDSLPAFTRHAVERLAALGWFFPELALRVERVSGAGLADLIIEVHSLGPRGSVQDFTVTGNQDNSTADILRFLGLKRGSRVTSHSLSQAEARLLNSGRFLEAELKAEPPQGQAQTKGIRLAIRVREYSAAPKLFAALDPKQQALLRVGNWLSHLDSRSKDAVLTFALPPPLACSGQLALSARGGAVLSFDNASSGPLAGYTLLSARSLLGLLALRDGSKLVFQAPDLAPTVACSLSPNAPGAHDPFNLTLGMGWRGGDQGQADNDAETPVLSLQLLPAAFFHFADAPGGVCHLHSAIFTLTNRYGRLKTKARTGEVLAYDYAASDCSVSLRFRQGAFRQARQVWETQALACGNSNQPGHFLAGIVSFLNREVVRELLVRSSPTNMSFEQRRLARRTLDRLFSAEVFAPLDAPRPAWSATGFVIPRDDVDRAIEQSGYSPLFPALLVRYGSGICPRDSWLHRLLMDAFLLNSNQAKNGSADLRNLCNAPGTGPLRCLVAAAMAAQFNLPVAAPLARRGLQLLSPEEFRADCGLLLDGEAGPARSFASMCRVFRNLRPAEIEALGASLPPVGAALLKQAYQAFRSHPSQPPAACLGDLLNACWTITLRGQVEAALQGLASTGPGLQDKTAKAIR